MRIAYLITRADTIGGAHVHLVNLALAMQRHGATVLIFAGQGGPFTEFLKQLGLCYEIIPDLGRPIRPRRDYYSYVDLRQQINEFRPDLISAHSAKTSWMARLVSASNGIPSVITVHGWSFSPGVPRGRRILYLLLERTIADLAGSIITVSHFDRRLAEESGVARNCYMTTIHNGIPDVSPAFFAAPNAEPPDIICTARFDDPKDHLTLVRALAVLQDIPWTLTLVGDGPLLPAIRGLVGRSGLSARVRFSGFRTDVAALLARSQMFVLLSKHEACPISILEAMRAGLPVIASDVGGVKELVHDGSTGLLVPPGGRDFLVQLLRRLITDSRLRSELGAAGRQRYENDFTFDHMFNRTLDVYVRALGNDRTPRNVLSNANG